MLGSGVKRQAVPETDVGEWRKTKMDRNEKQKLISELAAKGMTAPEIVQQTGINYKSVYYYMNREKYKPKKKKTEEIPVDYRNPDARPGWNADRKKCKTCRYRQAHYDSTDKGRGNCNYIEIAGHSRGCAVEDCDRYVKGARMNRKIAGVKQK